jgi:hypothetical protein
MKLLNTLLLLVRPSPPVTGVAPGAVYYDSSANEPRYSDGSTWNPFGQTGFPDPLSTTFTVPDGRQVMYFDSFTNDGVLTISGTGYLVGIR